MADKIVPYIFITIGIGFIAYAILGRAFGFHRPLRWVSGGHVSFTGELAIGIFILCGGLAISHSPVWAVFILPAFAVGYISQERERKRHLAKENALRQENAALYPGVFENPPPYDIESVNENELDVFDAGSCTYLGKASKNDIRALIDRFKDVPEQEPNDIFMLVESLEMIPKDSVSQEFIVLLTKAFTNRDYLEIRWLPLKQ